ncbi:Uncharacterised protein [Segatella copri]|nr:Uncharacterised protein [Segatella copri]
MGRIQMFECLKILLVLFLDMGDGEEVDGYSCMAYRSGATDTCAGDVVGVGCQSLFIEDVITGFYYALIVYIDVGDVYPGANQVAFHCHIRTFDSLQVFIEEKTGLFVRILSLSLLLCKAKTVKENGSLGVRCLDQQTHLAAIQWSLFHDSEVCAFQKLLIKERFF